MSRSRTWSVQIDKPPKHGRHVYHKINMFYAILRCSRIIKQVKTRLQKHNSWRLLGSEQLVCAMRCLITSKDNIQSVARRRLHLLNKISINMLLVVQGRCKCRQPWRSRVPSLQSCTELCSSEIMKWRHKSTLPEKRNLFSRRCVGDFIKNSRSRGSKMSSKNVSLSRSVYFLNKLFANLARASKNIWSERESESAKKKSFRAIQDVSRMKTKYFATLFIFALNYCRVKTAFFSKSV